MSSVNDYLSVSKTIPETLPVNSLQLYESQVNGTESTLIQANSSLTSDYTLTLPSTDGIANQVLQTDGSGNLSWMDAQPLDSDNNQQMVYPYETRFLSSDGTEITLDEYNTQNSNNEDVYIACFVGCTYHCG